MQELIAIGLTLPLVWVILKLMRRKARKRFSKTLYRQSDVHKLLKYFFSIRLINEEEPISQLTKRKEKNMTKVIFVDNQAYWVSENTFFVAESVNGEIKRQTARPVNTNGLSKLDLDKMLFILDSLKNGSKNDSGSSGNERL
jgi:hypothetical protein